MKRIWVSLVGAALLTVAAIAPAAGQDTITIDMQEVDDSGQSGQANITSDGDQVQISIEIDPGPDGEPQPVHIHEGDCRDLGDVAYPLEDVVDGVSESTADVSINELISGEYAINVHLSEDEMDVWVACGTLPHIAGPAEEEDDAAEEDDAVEEDDEDAVDDEDDAVVDDEDDAVTDDEDDAVVDDADDAVADDDDDVVEEEDDAAVEDDEEADDVEDLVPATGGEGMGAEGAVLLMTVLGGAALGTGLLVRRRFAQV